MADVPSLSIMLALIVVFPGHSNGEGNLCPSRLDGAWILTKLKFGIGDFDSGPWNDMEVKAVFVVRGNEVASAP